MSATATLIVDDTPTLIDTLMSTANIIGSKSATFFTSLSEAWQAAAESKYFRYVADQEFEGEEKTGIDFLEDVHQRQPNAELILLTGKYVSRQSRDRIDRIGASYIKKSQLDSDLLARILSSAPLPDNGLAVGPEVDIAELRLQYDLLNRELGQARELNDLLIEDIIAELTSIKSQSTPALMIEGRLLSADDLKKELKEKTNIGREMIRLHHELNRQLRKKR